VSDRNGIEAELLDVFRPLVADLVREELALQREESEPRTDEALSVAQIADLLNVTPKVVNGAINRGELPASEVGSKRRVRRSDLDAWLERKRVVHVAKGTTRPPPRGPRRVRPAASEGGLRDLLRPRNEQGAVS
jgi:excisionase family DNA binding protein